MNQSQGRRIKQFRLATYAHEAVRDTNTETDAAVLIKERIESEGVEDVRITEERINGQVHVVTAVPAKHTDLPPETGDVAVVPKLKTDGSGSVQDGHVAVVTAEDARQL